VGEVGPMKGINGPNVIGGSERPEGHPNLPIATSHEVRRGARESTSRQMLVAKVLRSSFERQADGPESLHPHAGDQPATAPESTACDTRNLANIHEDGARASKERWRRRRPVQTDPPAGTAGTAGICQICRALLGQAGIC
jgi:hypothetical protein